MISVVSGDSQKLYNRDSISSSFVLGIRKEISAVMAAQDDLIEIVHRLQQIVNVKG
jgi:hypothetical protein